MSPQKNNHDDRHTQLCAYLFGELDPREAAEVERLLAGDPTLREERARLEATITAVREAYPDSEALSDAARHDLIAAASSAGATQLERRFGPFRSMLVAAAAVLLIGSAWLLIREGSSDVASQQLATRPYEMPDRGGDESAVAGQLRVRQVSEPIKKTVSADALVRLDQDSFEAPVELSKNLPDLEVTARVMLDSSNVVISTASSEKLADSASQALLVINPPNGQPPTESLERVYPGPGDSLAGVVVGGQVAATEGAGTTPGLGGLGGPAGPATGGPATPGPTVRPTATPSGPRTGGGRGGKQAAEKKFRRSGAAEQLPARAPATDPTEPANRLASLGYVIGPAPVVSGSTGFLSGHGRKDVARANSPLTADQILSHCRPLPDETPSMMYFRFWGDNAFELTSLDRLATFAVDLDTASYALARNYLNRNLIPEKAQIRTEEFVNYFKPDLAPPTEGVFALSLEVADSLFGGPTGERWLLRVALRGKQVSAEQRKPLRLTFVIDTSGSMRQENRLELVKHTLRLLLTQLDERDQIAIVNFSTNAALCLPMTSVAHRGLIETALFCRRTAAPTPRPASSWATHRRCVRLATKLHTG